MSVYLGDYVAGETVYFMWNSNSITGASITRATDGTISVYKDASTTQTTTGVTDTENFDSLTGVHHCAIATTDGFYTTATDFMVVLSAATIDGVTVNAVLAHFSIENRSALRPTTAGRTLDVSAGGEAGVDWANVGSPTTAVNLSATNIDVDQVVASVSGTVATVNALAANSVTASALAADAGAEIADAVLDRDMSTGTDSGSTTVRTPRQALRALRNRAAISAGTLTVYKEDDATASWTGAVTTAAGDPISEINPAGP